MIAWYDYYNLPDANKFEKFEIPYYFLILFLEDIPQIIAQGFSIRFVYDNQFNVAVFVISIVALLVTTIYNGHKSQNHSFV